MPNMYARGILFGKMVIELGDTCTARCEKLGIAADIEFKTKVLLDLLFLFLLASPFAHLNYQPVLTFFMHDAFLAGFLFWCL